MSNAKIINDQIKDVVSLGARNYKVKPSTGYAFKNMYFQACELADSLTNSKKTEENVQHEKHREGALPFMTPCYYEFCNIIPNGVKQFSSPYLKEWKLIEYCVF